MFRRSLVLFFALALAGSFVTPALARWHLVGQSRSAGSGIYFGHALVPHHAYRLVVKGPRRQAFRGLAMEQYTFVSHKRLFVQHKTITLKGVTPHATTISQPVRYPLSSWTIIIQAALSHAHGITVQIYDLGKRK